MLHKNGDVAKFSAISLFVERLKRQIKKVVLIEVKLRKQSAFVLDLFVWLYLEQILGRQRRLEARLKKEKNISKEKLEKGMYSIFCFATLKVVNNKPLLIANASPSLIEIWYIIHGIFYELLRPSHLKHDEVIRNRS